MGKGKVDGKCGPTGTFPEGHYGEHDRGEIRIGITHDAAAQKVIINFAAPVGWMAMSPVKAIELASLLVMHARGAVENAVQEMCVH